MSNFEICNRIVKLYRSMPKTYEVFLAIKKIKFLYLMCIAYRDNNAETN